MPYHIDFKTVSLDDFKKNLNETDLVPSRKLLMDNIDDNFHLLKSYGYQNILNLVTDLKKKSLLLHISLKTGIDEHYLTILSREIRSRIPKPERLVDFSVCSKAIIAQLESMGIKNTKQLWEAGLTPSSREILFESMEAIPVDEIIDLVCLCDLCRVRWVNTTFAEILHMSGVMTAHQLSIQNYEDLHSRVVELNEINKWYKAKIGMNDFRLVIKAAGELSFDLQL